jgi:hypothetical protein
MGSLDFNTMKAQVKMRMSLDTALSAVSGTTDYYDIWVNYAYRQICASDYLMGIPRKVYHPELEKSDTTTTTSGTAYVSIPSDCLTIRTIYDATNKYKLDYIPWIMYLKYSDRTVATGNPREWVKAGDYIYLHPTPNATLSLNVFYKKIPMPLTGDNTTEIGAQWDEPIVLFAAYKGHNAMGEYDKAAKVREEIVEILNGIITVPTQEEKDRHQYFYPPVPYTMPGDSYR